MSDQQPSDIELSETLTQALDAIEDAVPRLAQAIARKRFPDSPNRDLDARHSQENAKRAVSVLREDIEALTYSDEARAHRRAKEEMHRIWIDAARLYRKEHPRSTPWHELTAEQRAEWFSLADDRVPPTWEELTPEQRKTWAGERDLPEHVVKPLFDKKRAQNLRRRASRRIEHANPYTVRGPQQRMEDVAAFAQTRSWAREEHARGDLNDLELAVWEEHYRRAFHAYTRPTEPYVTP